VLPLFLFCVLLLVLFFFTATATTQIYTLSLHDALPISRGSPGNELKALGDVPRLPAGGFDLRTETVRFLPVARRPRLLALPRQRSEEHTSELQSRSDLVCRLLLEKKKK